MEVLLARGAEVNEPDKNRLTPLMLAVQMGDLDSTRFLLNANADVNACPHGKQTALTLACSNNNLDLMNLLLADVNAVTTKGSSYFPLIPLL